MNEDRLQQQFDRALDLHRRGRLPEARRAYDAIIAAAPRHVGALHLSGVLAGQSGDFQAALGALERASAIAPDNAAIHASRAFALRHLRQWQAAVESYDRALALDPKPARVHAQRADVLMELGRLDAARDSYQQALAREPTLAEAHFGCGNVLRMAGDLPAARLAYERAIAARPTHAAARVNRAALLELKGDIVGALADYEAALAVAPDLAAAYNGRGNVRRAQHDPRAALADYDRALTLDPQLVAAHVNRGIAAAQLGRLEEAVASYDAALALAPQLTEAHLNRGAALIKAGRCAQALQSLERAIELNPRDAVARFNRGRAFLELGRHDEALESFTRAVELDPGHVAARVNSGFLYGERMDFAAALRLYDEALVLSPQEVEAHYNRATALLLLGDYERGWPEYEWRWPFTRTSPKIAAGHEMLQPLWLGSESLVGKRIVLHWEQGLGDTLQFCRFAKLVAERGAEVSLLVPAPLCELLSKLAGAVRVSAELGDCGDFDYHCPLMSLPLACGTTLATVPAAERYLQPDPDRVARWSARLGEPSRPRVGLAWSGRATQASNRRRSIPLDQVLAALPEGLDYFCLQREILAADQAAYAAQDSIWLPDGDFDLSETAALCALMDVVVTVDTSIAHLAAALGRPTWIMLPRNCDWRWLLDRDDSPWYPSARLYRQPVLGDWESVLARVVADLASLATQTPSADGGV